MAPANLEPARAALANGRTAQAVRLAWEGAMPAVLRQDPQQLEEAIALANEIAAASEGRTRADAEQLAAYCAGCILEPADAGAPWSIRRIFGRRAPKRKKCPDCAEKIAPDAKVCRYCGYRYPEAVNYDSAPPTD